MFRNRQAVPERQYRDNHGLQMVNGPNPMKVFKTMVVLTSGMVLSFGASAILFDNTLSMIFGGLLLSLIMVRMLSQYAIALGERRRAGSNVIENTERFIVGLFSRRGAAESAYKKELFNLFNGCAKIFDDFTPAGLKALFEEWVNEHLISPNQPRLR